MIYGASVMHILSFLSLVCHLDARYDLVLYVDGALPKAPSQRATLKEGV